jgi:NAD+ kinase
MKIARVLCVYRKSLYQIYVREHQERSVREALRSGDAGADALRQSHEANETALREVERVLRQLRIEAVVRWRAHVRTTSKFDLVISLGGDGTLLDTSHRVSSATPLLGINSDPARSVGALCAGSVDELPALLDGLLSDRLRPRRVTRMRVRLDGREVLGPIINDVLFAHACPAGLSRFDLAVLPAARAEKSHSGFDGKIFRQHRGSGLWISTAMGSTAAIRSAGGRVMATGSRSLQYVVREPYRRPSSTERVVRGGMVRPGQTLVLITRMRQGMLWADGAHRRVALGYSQQLQLDRHPLDLLLVRPTR